MTKPTDDLEAVRIVVQALEPFDSKDRDRIIRWSCEKLGMMTPQSAESTVQKEPQALESSAALQPKQPQIPSRTPIDIRSFILTKNPKSDNHLAAVVAYYHRFEAPASERRDFITKDDLIDACRKADRDRPARPAQVMVNTYHAGLLDKAERGQYRLNSVGENLVAMVLPEKTEPSVATQSAPPRKRPTSKKSSRAAKRQKKTQRKTKSMTTQN